LSSRKWYEAGGEVKAAAAVGRRRPLGIQVRNFGGPKGQIAQELWCRCHEHDRIIVALTMEHGRLVAALRRKEEGELVWP